MPLIMLLSLCIPLCMCASGQVERIYERTFTKELSAHSGTPAAESIDGEKTYEMYFKLKEKTDCIKISITSSYYTDSLPRKKLPAKAFFIVERSINISQFKNSDKEIYSVIAKNHTTQWDHQPAVTICTSSDEPLELLDNVSIYRIRFTSLSKENFLFTVSIYADTDVSLIER